MTLHDLISAATRSGYKVTPSDDVEGWSVHTPRAPRRPAQELGAFKDERTAWAAAALLASQDD
jgi:hypothetical protein